MYVSNIQNAKQFCQQVNHSKEQEKLTNSLSFWKRPQLSTQSKLAKYPFSTSITSTSTATESESLYSDNGDFVPMLSHNPLSTTAAIVKAITTGDCNKGAKSTPYSSSKDSLSSARPGNNLQMNESEIASIDKILSPPSSNPITRNVSNRASNQFDIEFDSSSLAVQSHEAVTEIISNTKNKNKNKLQFQPTFISNMDNMLKGKSYSNVDPLRNNIRKDFKPPSKWDETPIQQQRFCFDSYQRMSMVSRKIEFQIVPQDVNQNQQPIDSKKAKLQNTRQQQNQIAESNFPQNKSHQSTGKANPNSVPNKSRSDGEQHSPSVFSQRLEISPGCYVPLRTSIETSKAFERGLVSESRCFCCQVNLIFPVDAEYVLCSECMIINPVEGAQFDISYGCSIVCTGLKKSSFLK